MTGVMAPIERCRRSRPGRVLPFRFREEPVRKARLLTQPLRIGLRFVPAHFDDGLAPASPTVVSRPVQIASAVLYAGVPVVERDIELARSEGPSNGHRARWSLIQVSIRF